MQDKRRFFSGATLEQAVARAARHYGVDPAELAYRERKKKHGFLHRRRGIVVEVNPSDLVVSAGPAGDEAVTVETASAPDAGGPLPGKEEEDSWGEPVHVATDAGDVSGEDGSDLFSAEWWQGEEGAGSPAKSKPEPDLAAAPQPVGSGSEVEAAREGLRKLLALAGVALEIEVRQGEDRLEVELSGNDQQVVLDRGGELLLALEHLLPRVIRGLAGAGVPCRVDADGFHVAREERLRELAEKRAGEVLLSRRRRTLPPMSPEERRIVHLALAERADVQTESRGEGFFKRVTIFPGGQR